MSLSLSIYIYRYMISSESIAEAAGSIVPFYVVLRLEPNSSILAAAAMLALQRFRNDFAKTCAQAPRKDSAQGLRKDLRHLVLWKP